LTPLFLAAEMDKKNMILFLLLNGVNPHHTNNNGDKVLDLYADQKAFMYNIFLN
jgi:ankyrin repeat protein